jgi:hypothetical protein
VADHPLTPDRLRRLARPLNRFGGVGISEEAQIEQLQAAAATQFHKLDIRDRLLVRDIVWPEIVTAPTSTDEIVVNFDYCVVRVRRPWMFDVFINSDNWAIPGTERGALSDQGMPGAITQLPVGMVVIRDLAITANWSADDIATSKNAMAFGPFKVDSGIVNNSLTHKSIQTMGWLLQRMQPLPPRAYQPDPQR